LHECSDERPSGKTGVPDPPHPLCLVTIFERDPAQDQAREHQQQRQIKRREERGIDDRKRTPEDHTGDDRPRLSEVNAVGAVRKGVIASAVLKTP
jgi:hypothetical protein